MLFGGLAQAGVRTAANWADTSELEPLLATCLMLLNLSTIALIWASTLGRGVAIAITGMLIVACALILICLFIMALPRVLDAMAVIWPESDEPHGGTTHPDSLVLEEEEILAAIGYVLHHRLHSQKEASASAASSN